MDSIPISKFKASCTSIVARVQATQTPIVITRRGKPVAEIIPHIPRSKPKRRLGYMSGTARILGDLVHLSDESIASLGAEAGLTPRKLRDRSQL